MPLPGVKPDFDVGIRQMAFLSHPILVGGQFMEDEMHHHFHKRHQGFTHVKCFQVRLEVQCPSLATLIVHLFFLHGFDGHFMGGTQVFEVVVGGPVVQIVSRQGCCHVQNVLLVPLQLLEGVCIESVVVQQVLKVGLVQVGVRLETDQHSIEGDIALFDQGVAHSVWATDCHHLRCCFHWVS